MTLEYVINVLTDYNIKHIEVPLSTDYYGLCSYGERTLYIINNQEIPQKHNTIIHELYHAFWGSKNLKHTEKDVEKYTSNLYKQLYENKK
jgi:Zn-dependent peptidase ImmA (M78 family)